MPKRLTEFNNIDPDVLHDKGFLKKGPKKGTEIIKKKHRTKREKMYFKMPRMYYLHSSMERKVLTHVW